MGNAGLSSNNLNAMILYNFTSSSVIFSICSLERADAASPDALIQSQPDGNASVQVSLTNISSSFLDKCQYLVGQPRAMEGL